MVANDRERLADAWDEAAMTAEPRFQSSGGEVGIADLLFGAVGMS